MKCLVLGSEGQIGRHLVQFLRERGNKVSTLDITNGTHEDISNPTVFNAGLLKDIDFVFFLAFDVGGSKYLKEYQRTFNFVHNNIKILKNVFEVLEQSKTPFIFTSTQMSDLLDSSYGLTKRIGETYTSILSGMCVRLWNVYGYEKDYNKSHVITDFILQAKQTGVINSLTTGNESRQFLHVEDCCNALYTLQQRYFDLDKQDSFHVSTFKWHTIKEVASIIQANIKCEINFSKELDTVQQDSKITPNTSILSIWQPVITLEEGIKDIIQYYM